MAKCIGPLLSVEATGTIGKRMTFSGGKDGAIVRFFLNPPTSSTPHQLVNRGLLRLLGYMNKRITANGVGSSPDNKLSIIEYYNSIKKEEEVWTSCFFRLGYPDVSNTLENDRDNLKNLSGAEKGRWEQFNFALKLPFEQMRNYDRNGRNIGARALIFTFMQAIRRSGYYYSPDFLADSFPWDNE